MDYEIVETTSYVVDGRHFSTKQDAQAHALLKTTWERISASDSGYRSLYDLMEECPQSLIQQLLDYVAARKAIYNDITGENFDLVAAQKAAQLYDALSINHLGDVRRAAIYLSKDMDRKIDAIKLVRDCFKKRPSLLEVKNWVEAL